jgi:outer membrane receptor protein involved in Fe transport
LFAPSFQDNPLLEDPCNFDSAIRSGASPTVDAAIVTLCAQQVVQGFALFGVSVTQGSVSSFFTPGGLNFKQANGQISAISGGNPNLQEETADTYTFGMTYQSESESPWLEGLSLAIDYWNIEIDGPIGVDAGSILYSCFNADGSNPTYSTLDPNCQLIFRTTGDIYYISAFLTNQVSTTVSGVDLQVVWAFDLDHMGMTDAGSLTFQFSGTWLEQYLVQTSALAPAIDVAGTISQVLGTAYPEYKWQLAATWAIDDFEFTGRVNFIDEMTHANVPIVGPDCCTGVPEVYYYDFFANWSPWEELTIRAGVLNIENLKPPLYTPSVQDNTDPSTYDVIGRRYFVGATVRF